MNKPAKILGFAFIFQFVTSFSNGVFLKSALIVPDNISETMSKIAANPSLMRAYMLVDMLTALGIIFLGVMLFLNLKKQSETIALVALCFYVLEAALLAVSKLESFSLLRMSLIDDAAAQTAYLQTMANVSLETMEFVGGTLHMLVFCPGAILFYYLLYKSDIVPRALSLWGLITVSPCLIGTLMTMFGYDAPIFLYVLYIPFELAIGGWLLVKGADV
jgi:hypothetical protein